MSTAVDAILVGKDRRFNRGFQRMCSHHLVEPTACTPAAGWEKGQVENQVKTSRDDDVKALSTKVESFRFHHAKSRAV